VIGLLFPFRPDDAKVRDMNDAALYPLKFEHVYKDYLWGGDRIIRRFARMAPPGVYAESWEVSAHPDGMSVVAGGPLAGQTLAGLVDTYGRQLVGSRTRTSYFPLLIKLIDAKQQLSVQVHPNDATAAAHGGEAKTEMWYVLDADPDAYVYAGLQAGTTAETLKTAVADDTVEDLMVTIPVTAGDAIFIPGGRVHAIGTGCLLLEVQQTSNTTYRLYDWARKGPDGKTRELHVDQALQVIDFDDIAEPKVCSGAPPAAGAGYREVYQSPYFRMEHASLDRPIEGATNGSTFEVLFCASGRATLESDAGQEAMPAGTSILIPAAPCSYRLVPEHKTAEVLRVTVP
jgi:mannose-6-phosphate isomerase